MSAPSFVSAVPPEETAPITWRDLPPLASTWLTQVLTELDDPNPDLTPSGTMSGIMERLLPLVMSRVYPQWRGASLDAIYVARVTECSVNTLELFALGILIRDQCETPIWMRLQHESNGARSVLLQVAIGERGGGALGISGRPVDASLSTRVAKLAVRSKPFAWIYEVVCNGPLSP